MGECAYKPPAWIGMDLSGADDQKKFTQSDVNFLRDLIALGWRSNVEELEAKIARLEAENESLSRQLRSRELNKEPATGGKVWRWSPMV